MKRFFGAAALLPLTLVSATALASSHREAPSLAQDPSVDLTDIYAFKTPGSADHFTFIMNVYPAMQGYAGPNWYQFAYDAIYEMHIDTTGDGVEDTSYRFQFETAPYKDAEGLIIANFPAITFDATTKRFTGSLSQIYNVTKIAGVARKGGEKTQIAKSLPVAPPRIGPYTTDNGGEAVVATSTLLNDEAKMYANYKALSDNAITTVDGRKFFAGPRNDPFFVDLGGVFDRVGVRIPGLTGTPKDSLLNSNVMSIAFEVPISDFLPTGKHFGVWATVSRPQGRILRIDGKNHKNGGAWVQVSRLGNPLVNEVVIKINDKDKFNFTEPKDDAANFAPYVVKPQLAYVLNALYAGDSALTAKGLITKIDEEGRDDLVAAFVTGLPGINKFPDATGSGDMIRVNLDFGIQEWPLSGRGLKDDVVNAALTFLAQCKKLMANSTKPDNPFGKVDPPVDAAASPVPANCLLDDFITADTPTPGNPGMVPLATFPYMDLPYSAYGKQN